MLGQIIFICFLHARDLDVAEVFYDFTALAFLAFLLIHFLPDIGDANADKVATSEV